MKTDNEHRLALALLAVISAVSLLCWAFGGAL